MNTFIGSDFHWGHTNILKYNATTRPYNDVHHMNESMVLEWNTIVSPDDKVYMLGDISFMSVDKTVEYLKRCNGTKILVAGNHDHKLLKHDNFRECFEEIHNYLEVNYNGTSIVMCHFPFAAWNKSHKGGINLHGHLHGSPSGMSHLRSRDVGMDATGKILTKLDDMVADALTGEISLYH